jgi:hypothetical protein
MNELYKQGFDRYCLLHQVIKQLTTQIVGLTIEPKRKFIKGSNPDEKAANDLGKYPTTNA